MDSYIPSKLPTDDFPNEVPLCAADTRDDTREKTVVIFHDESTCIVHLHLDLI